MGQLPISPVMVLDLALPSSASSRNNVEDIAGFGGFFELVLVLDPIHDPIKDNE
jgi:hypothetical protein